MVRPTQFALLFVAFALTDAFQLAHPAFRPRGMGIQHLQNTTTSQNATSAGSAGRNGTATMPGVAGQGTSVGNAGRNGTATRPGVAGQGTGAGNAGRNGTATMSGVAGQGTGAGNAGRNGTATMPGVTGQSTGASRLCHPTTITTTRTELVNTNISTSYFTTTVTSTGADSNVTATNDYTGTDLTTSTSDVFLTSTTTLLTTITTTADFNTTETSTTTVAETDTVTDYSTDSVTVTPTTTVFETTTSTFYGRSSSAPAQLLTGRQLPQTQALDDVDYYGTSPTALSMASTSSDLIASSTSESMMSSSPDMFESGDRVCRVMTRTVPISELPRAGTATTCPTTVITKTVTAFVPDYPAAGDETSTGTTVITISTTVDDTPSPSSVIIDRTTILTTIVTASVTDVSVVSEPATATQMSDVTATITEMATTTTTDTVHTPGNTTITITAAPVTSTDTVTADPVTVASFRWSINPDTCSAPCGWPGWVGFLEQNQGSNGGDQVDFGPSGGSNWLIDDGQAMSAVKDGDIAYSSTLPQRLQLLDVASLNNGTNHQLYCGTDNAILSCVDYNNVPIQWLTCGDGWLWIGNAANPDADCAHVELDVLPPAAEEPNEDLVIDTSKPPIPKCFLVDGIENPLECLRSQDFQQVRSSESPEVRSNIIHPFHRQTINTLTFHAPIKTLTSMATKATPTTALTTLSSRLLSKPIPPPPRSRLWDLYTTSSRIFGHSPNPTGARRGSKILRAPLLGPKLAAYYPPRVSTLKEMNALIRPLEMETYDEEEVLKGRRLDLRKARGKGAPRKRRTLEDSRSAKKKKKPTGPPKPAGSEAIWGNR
ncbi:MAG: mitochondral 37S ribosomal protein S27 [Chrysothrix sp. TS-e1954]|nr:MAG: mitochondral 37S ribosomal protein S27 [Chrysothrix sp. TS-e1954]